MKMLINKANQLVNISFAAGFLSFCNQFLYFTA